MKRLWSIFTDDMDHCMYTGQYGVERHHVFSHTSRERKLGEINEMVSARRLPGCCVDIKHLFMVYSMSRYVSHCNSPRCFPGGERRKRWGNYLSRQRNILKEFLTVIEMRYRDPGIVLWIVA